MKTVSIDMKAKNVQIDASDVFSVNVTVDVDEKEINNILDEFGLETIAEYMRDNNYSCELTNN